jgi:hypothetical protein
MARKKNAAEIKEPDEYHGLVRLAMLDFGGINASLTTLRSSGNGAISTAPRNCSVRLIHK